MRPIVLPLLALLAAAPLAAQEKLVESIEVRVVNVDVVVTDRAGNPITGLTKDDFEILENGKPQKITNIYEIRPDNQNVVANIAGALEEKKDVAPPPPEEMRVRRVALFVDNSSLQVFDRTKVVKSLEKFVEANLHANDELSLVTWNPGLKIVMPFTSDRAKLKAALRAMAEHVNSGPSDMVASQDRLKKECRDYIDQASSRPPMLSWSQAWEDCKSAVNQYGDQMAMNAKNVLEGMRLTSTTLAGLDGKKVMIIAGAHLPERPGLDLMMWAMAEFQRYLPRLNPGQAMTETSHNLQTFSIEKFARQANADGVTIYVIDAYDARNSTSAEVAGDMNEDPSAKTSAEFATFTNTAQAYQTIARITGGVMMNSNNFDSAFTVINKDLGYYYSLGYKPSDDSKSAKDRRIVVRAKNPEYRIRSRQSYTPKSAEDQINDRVVANIYNSTLHSDWPIRIVTGDPQREGDRFKIPVEISIPATVTLLPQEGQLVGGFDVYIAVGTDGGAMSKVSKAAQPIKIPADGEASLRSRPMTYSVPIVVRPGESTLSIAVVDQISGSSGFARARLVAH